MGDEEGMGKQSDPVGASEGWSQSNALVVSSRCDKVFRGGCQDRVSSTFIFLSVVSDVCVLAVCICYRPTHR